MPRTETPAAWLDAALTEHLGIVRAPEELWDRVRMPRFVPARRAVLSPRWRPATVSALAVLMAVALWSFRQHESGSREFRSGDAVAMRAWLKDRTGLDVPLAAGGSPVVKLASARFWNKAGVPNGANGPTSADVTFFVENRPATLRVSPAGTASALVPQHRLLDGAANRGSAVSWVARGQIYTLACASPEDLRIACSLCHGAGTL